jgi:glycosyltransferase involved in cell wall biosynthesis
MLKNKNIIVLFTPGPIGGAEKVVLTGVKEFQKQGYKISLWIIAESRVQEVSNKFIHLAHEEKLQFKVFTSRSVVDRQLIKELKLALHQESPSIIHAHGFKATVYGKLVKPKGSIFITTHHGVTSHTLKVKLYEKVEKEIMKRSDAVIAVSGPMKEGLVRAGIPKEKIKVVENPLSIQPLPVKTSNGIPLELLFVGRLSIEKGCDYLLKALPRLPEKESIKVTVIGDGLEKDRLIQLAAELKLTNVVFKGFQKDVTAFLAQADALIMPSLREGMPMALIEACSMGVPVLGSKVGAIADLVIHGKNGILFQPADPEDLAQAIIHFQKNSKAYRQEAKKRSNWCKRKFSPENWVQSTSRIYSKLLKQ